MAIRAPAPSASIANETDESGKLYAPSAERNGTDLCNAIASIAPETGDALEIASGTGQHITTFAAAMPKIHWHPTEVETTRLASITVYIVESGLPNIAPPTFLNATQSGWADKTDPKDLITLANLLHLISTPEAETLIAEAAKTLAKDGTLLLYGPYKRDGQLTSEGDASFDAKLRTHDAETGYKDNIWVIQTAQSAGLKAHETIDMPANNLALVFKKP